MTRYFFESSGTCAAHDVESQVQPWTSTTVPLPSPVDDEWIVMPSTEAAESVDANMAMMEVASSRRLRVSFFNYADASRQAEGDELGAPRFPAARCGEDVLLSLEHVGHRSACDARGQL